MQVMHLWSHFNIEINLYQQIDENILGIAIKVTEDRTNRKFHVLRSEILKCPKVVLKSDQEQKIEKVIL